MSTDELSRAWVSELAGIAGDFSLVLRSGAEVVTGLNADRPHYAASTIKLAVLCTWLERRTKSPELIRVHDVFTSAAGGSFALKQSDDQDDQTWARLGDEVDTAVLAERMITVSSNIAMDLLVEHLGIGQVHAFLDRAGLAGSLRVGRLIGDSAAGVTNKVTAEGLASLMAGVADASMLSAKNAEDALSILARQTRREMIPSGLPSGVWSASKGGWAPGVNHDVALVRAEALPPFVLAICTTHHLNEAEGRALVARLSRTTWEHWKQWHKSQR